jgi:hypothetical protein
MAASASWLSIAPGWKVMAADGSQIGEVDEAIGDENSDIFDGLSIAMSALGQPRYARADQVASIEQGSVRLSLTREQAAQLQEYLQPATSAEIEPDDHGGMMEGVAAEARKVEGEIAEPTQRREHPFNILTRIAHLIRRVLHR